MQRKFDQLEARRAAEKTAAARLLEARRSQAREAKGSAEDEHQAQLMEKEQLAVALPFHRYKKEPPMGLSKNAYPVRSGPTALSCSEVNLRSAVASNCKTPSVQRLLCKPESKARSEALANGLRGSGDGEAVDTSEGDEDGSGLCKSSHKSAKSARVKGGESDGRLHSGLSLSSLHRLSTADSSLSVSHSTHPKLFVKPKAKSNRMVIVNAIGYACLAGAVNEPMKQATLKTSIIATLGSQRIPTTPLVKRLVPVDEGSRLTPKSPTQENMTERCSFPRKEF
ncbi:unnamed protein product [Dicrocoelium dendriticum]|nr:unnamed protein product [Dicrocoelium dendriticum]